MRMDWLIRERPSMSRPWGCEASFWLGRANRGADAIATHKHNIFSGFICERSNAPNERFQSIVFLVSPPGYDPGTL